MSPDRPASAGTGLITAFVGNPVKVVVGVLLVALFGTIGLAQVPKQLGGVPGPAGRARTV